MFKQAIIHYPEDEASLKQIYKELAAFRCTAAIKYIESLNLTDMQIETLYTEIEKVISEKQQQSA